MKNQQHSYSSTDIDTLYENTPNMRGNCEALPMNSWALPACVPGMTETRRFNSSQNRRRGRLRLASIPSPPYKIFNNRAAWMAFSWRGCSLTTQSSFPGGHRRQIAPTPSLLSRARWIWSGGGLNYSPICCYKFGKKHGRHCAGRGKEGCAKTGKNSLCYLA